MLEQELIKAERYTLLAEMGSKADEINNPNLNTNAKYKKINALFMKYLQGNIRLILQEETRSMKRLRKVLLKKIAEWVTLDAVQRNADYIKTAVLLKKYIININNIDNWMGRNQV